MKVAKVKIEVQTPVPVYDVTVPGYENFCLSNGIVVHNSKDIADSVCGAHWNCSTATQIYSVKHHVSASLEDNARKAGPQARIKEILRQKMRR